MTSHLELSAVVRAFCDAIREVAAAARETTPAGTWLSRLLVECRTGERARTGVLAGGIGYQIHGAGGHFILPDGRVVDVDVEASNGEPTFDRWRYMQFACSLDLNLADEDAERALVAAEALGYVTVVRPGWYRPGPTV